jgi:hypothetical protein
MGVLFDQDLKELDKFGDKDAPPKQYEAVKEWA